MNNNFDPLRRQVLIGSAVALASASLLSLSPISLAAEMPLPDYVNWKTPEALIVHSANTLETKRDAIGTSIITSNEQLFIRNNLPPPPPSIMLNREAWTVAFQGVKNPRSMTLGELKTLGVTTVASVLQCSGNGRAFFDHESSGTQWTTGAAGCVLWSGVPLKAVVEALGGNLEGLPYITSTGAEELPAGLDPKSLMVERSVPLQALDQAILAWELNGEPLSLAHGGPLRLVVPGYYGVNNIKYVKQVAFTAAQTDAAIQASGYRIRPVGQGGAPDQPSMWEMNVKSWITHPLTQAKAGRLGIQGVAFGGAKEVKSIEVSLDGGKNWQAAAFVGPNLGPYAWRPFVLFANLKPGNYSLMSRATDVEGNAQPPEELVNERGYGHNGWRDHGVKITIA